MNARLVAAGAGTAVRAPEADRAALRDFLFEEARVLDAQDPAGWLTLLAADIRYYMPSQPAHYRRYREKMGAGERLALYDDDLEMLKRRVARMVHPTAWSEDPPTRSVRQVTNIEAFEAPAQGAAPSWIVLSALAIYRSRNEADHDLIFARRRDLIRRDPEGLRLAQRTVTLSQNTLLSKNLNVFF